MQLSKARPNRHAKFVQIRPTRIPFRSLIFILFFSLSIHLSLFFSFLLFLLFLFFFFFLVHSSSHATSHDDRYVIETFYTRSAGIKVLSFVIFLLGNRQKSPFVRYIRREMFHSPVYGVRSITLTLPFSLSFSSVFQLLCVSKWDKKIYIYTSKFLIFRKRVHKNLFLSFSLSLSFHLIIFLICFTLKFVAMSSQVSVVKAKRGSKLQRSIPCREKPRDSRSRLKRRKRNSRRLLPGFRSS